MISIKMIDGSRYDCELDQVKKNDTGQLTIITYPDKVVMLNIDYIVSTTVREGE